MLITQIQFILFECFVRSIIHAVTHTEL